MEERMWARESKIEGFAAITPQWYFYHVWPPNEPFTSFTDWNPVLLMKMCASWQVLALLVLRSLAVIGHSNTENTRECRLTVTSFAFQWWGTGNMIDMYLNITYWCRTSNIIHRLFVIFNKVNKIIQTFYVKVF